MPSTRKATISQADLRMGQQLVLQSLRSVHWRHHGAGMLQAYLAPGLRAHIWHRSLRLPGAAVIHDHRFNLQSTVLLGRLNNKEVWADSRAGTFFHEVYEVENTCNERGAPPQLVGPFGWSTSFDEPLQAGDRYWITKRVFHATELQSELAVTLVAKRDEGDGRPRILVPRGYSAQTLQTCCGAVAPAHHTAVGPDVTGLRDCPVTPEAMEAAITLVETGLRDALAVEPRPHYVYIAASFGAADHYQQVRAELVKLGLRVTYDWTQDGYTKNSLVRLSRIAEAMTSEISLASLVVVLLPAGRATHGELAIALALGKPVVIVGPDELFRQGPATCPLYFHPNVMSQFPSDQITPEGVAARAKEVLGV